MNTLKRAGTALLAALLLTPPASAAKHAQTRKQKEAARADELITKGLSALESHKCSSAIEDFSKAAQLGAGSAAYFLLGYAHYQRGFLSGSPESADHKDALETINAYETALAMDPKLSKLAKPDQLYFTMALSYEALNAPDKAMAAYKKAFTAAPDKPMIPLYAARLRYKLNDLAKASSNLALSLKVAKTQGKEAALLKTIDSNPVFSMLRSIAPRPAEVPPAPAPMVAANSGGGETLRDSVKGTTPGENRKAALENKSDPALDMLKNAEGEFKFRRYREAIAAYNDTLTINMQSGTLSQAELALIQERIGTSYAKLGQTAEAIRALERSLQHSPYNASAYYQLALAHALSGSYAESLHALSSAFEAAPSGGELRKYMLLAKTDTELEPVRDLPGFKAIVADFGDRVARR